MASSSITKSKAQGDGPDVTLLKTLLKSVGVDMSSSKMNASALEARLQSALRKIQDLQGLPLPVELTGCPEYVPKGNSLSIDFCPEIMAEVKKRMMEHQLTGSSSRPPLWENPFNDFRASLRNILAHHREKRTCFIFKTPSDTDGVCLRTLEMRTLSGPDDTIPILTLLFAEGSASTPREKNLPIQWLASFSQSRTTTMVVTVQASEQELALVKRVLHLNAGRISPSYSPERRPKEEKFTPSFFVPIEPLSNQDAGKIASRQGCSVCGKPAPLSSCSACKTALYCSSSCQAQHWKAHKVFCGKVKAAEWRKMPLSLTAGIPRGMYSMNIDNSKTVKKAQKAVAQPPSWSDDAIAPNEHGSSVFLLKLAVTTIDPTMGHTDTMPPGIIFCYDMQRSFRAQLTPEMAPDFHRDCLKEIFKGKDLSVDLSSGKMPNLKTYRLARRTGDRELSVCLSVAIEPEPTW